MSNVLDRSAILAVSDIQTRTVAVPEWGGDVLVRGMTGLERDQYETSILDQRGKKAKVDLLNARARLASMTIVDEKGDRVFTDADVVALGKKSAAALDRIYDVAAALSGISDDDLDDLLGKDVTTNGGGSPSD